VGDMLPPAQRTSGFAMQSFFIGIGAIVASFLPWIFTNWLSISNTATPGVIPDSVKYSFYLGAFMLFITVMWTVFSTKEYPPDLEQEKNLTNREKRRIDNEPHFRKKFFDAGLILLAIAIVLSVVVYVSKIEKELYVLAFGFGLFGIVHILSAVYISQGRSYLGIVNMVKDFNTMPKTMIQLAFVQFFSWFALFAMWIYTTPAVTSYIFNSTDTTSTAYNNGADLVGNLFGIYNGIAALAALLLPLLAKYTSRRITHMIALMCGGMGLISFFFVTNPSYLYVSMIGVGIAWASILSVPYAMLSGSLPSEKMGYYMGVFNFFIVIPQIVAGTVLGFMLNHFFNGQSIYILVAGGVSMFIAGLLCLRVNDSDEVVIKQTV
jgi:maltose/moltooligosaccharide transporter